MKEIILVNIFWMLFYAVYYFGFRKETYFQFSRFYLLFSLIGAVILVKIPMPEWNHSTNFLAKSSLLNTILEKPTDVPNFNFQDTENQNLINTKSISVSEKYEFQISNLYYFYYAISGILLLRFAVGLIAIFRLIWRGKKECFSRWTWLVFVPEKQFKSFSFGRFIFLNERDKTIIEHELAHIKQGHSLDILLVEILLILFWWNPVLWFYRWSLRLTHEFLADKNVTSKLWDKESYAKILMEQSMY